MDATRFHTQMLDGRKWHITSQYNLLAILAWTTQSNNLLSLSYTPRVSNLFFMEKGHTGYCVLVRGPHVKN
jgi:hypothetical protein